MNLMALFLIPAVTGLLVLMIPARFRYLHGIVTFLATLGTLILALGRWGATYHLIIPWVGPGLDFDLRYYPFSQFIVAAVAGFSLLITIYAAKFMADRPAPNQFFGFLLISEAMAIGASLANHLVVMLFFWEGLLITLFAMINIGGERAYWTALKAFIIVGLSDLCLMLGIGLTGVQAKTFVMTDIHLSTAGINGVAFVLMLIGAMAKAGAMPFHTWIPDAAGSAPLPFMAFLPAALEKLLGIYLVARICLDLFTLDAGMRVLVMSIGAVTILFAVAMALIQKDFKRLLSYHAISQVGYMILGIGTGMPLGIVGGLFHMINHAMYKSCLFLTGGAVEKQTGTTDLRKLGGLGRKMPITFTCFCIAAASISGVYFTNGFASKELIFDGVLETMGAGRWIFFTAAALGAVLTAASFLKLGHAAFLGKPSAAMKKVKEVSWIMVLPMAVLALGCLFFGMNFDFPLNHLIKPALAASLGAHIEEIHFAYHPTSWLFWLTLAILVAALINHRIGVKLSGKGLGASEHIHHAPLLRNIYDLAERRAFDPYHWGRTIGTIGAQGFFYIDRGVDWIYQQFVPGVAEWLSKARHAHNGRYANYLAWSLLGLAIVVVYIAF